MKTKIKNAARLALSKIFESGARNKFRTGKVREGVEFFQRALDLNDNARLDLLERIGPQPDATMEKQFVESGEGHLLNGEDQQAGKDFSAAIALSGSFTEHRNLEKTIRPLTENDNLIVTQVAINYFPIFEIWYRNMMRLGIRNILLIALDPLAAKRAEERDIPFWYLPIFGFQKSVRRLIWTDTLKVRQKILNLGVNYLHSDADAIWLADARSDVFDQRADIVSSTALGTPQSALDAWGFVLCLGFYSVRSTEYTRAMYDRYIEYTKSLGHDQNGLNQMLLDYGFEWRLQNDGFSHGSSDKLAVSVTALPQRIVARPQKLSEWSTTKVLHPVLSASTIAAKIGILKNFGIDAGDRNG